MPETPPPPPQQRSQARSGPDRPFTGIRQWRLALAIGCALVVLHVPLDLQYPEGRRAAAWRLLWAAVFGVAWRLQDERRPRLARFAAHAAAALSGVLVSVIIAYTGGGTNVRMGFLLVLPALVALVVLDLPWAALLTGLGTFSGGFILLVRDGRGAAVLAEWAVLCGVVAAVTTLGTATFARLWRSENQARRAEAEALERLSASELVRERAERLALAGRLAARVAHDISNPLASVKANLGFVRAELERPGGSPDESRQAIDEARQAAERIARLAGDLRDLVGEGPDLREPFDLEAAVDDAWVRAGARLATVRAERRLAPGLRQVLGNRQLLARALAGLLEDAAATAALSGDPDRRWVSLSAAPEGDVLEVVVEGGGPGGGPAPDRLAGEPQAALPGASASLGLDLAREQVVRCGGTLTRAGRPGGGARVMVRLPEA